MQVNSGTREPFRSKSIKKTEDCKVIMIGGLIEK